MMKNLPIPRFDKNPALRAEILKHCRLRRGEIWDDPFGKHRVGGLDAANLADVRQLMDNENAILAIQDPPYNLGVFEHRRVDEFIG